MINKKVSTVAGSLIILAIVVAIGFVFLSSKEKEVQDQNNVVLNNSSSEDKEETIKNNKDLEKNYPRPDRSKHNQPNMHTLADEANKSPEQLVEDFYDWYIKITNYWRYQIYGSDHKLVADIIDINALTQDSVFVTHNYKQNIAKRKTNGDPVLCTQDTNYNVIKEYGDAQISNNSAQIDIVRGYQDISNVAKIQIILNKERNQWKIDDIVCGQ